MSKTLSYRLFGVGKTPEHLAVQLKREGIQLWDEGIKGSATYSDFRAPGRYSKWKRQWHTASIVLTEVRLLALQYSHTIIGTRIMMKIDILKRREMTKHLLLLLGVTLLLVQSGAAQTSPKQTQTKPAGERKVTDTRRADFLNFVYPSSLCSKVFGLPRMVRVRKGNFQNSDSYYRVANKIVYGDLTGDRREEAIVHIRCRGFAGNFSDNEIFIYTLQSGRAKLLARLDTEGLERDYLRYYPGGFLVGISDDGVRMEKGHLIVEIFADGSNAGPENIAALDYQLRGARLVLSGKPKRRPA